MLRIWLKNWRDIMGKLHSRSSVAFARRLAAHTPSDSICPWCNVELWQRGKGKVEGDHVVPMDPDSEIVVCHTACNRRRHGILPDSKQIDNVINHPKVVRSCSSEQMLKKLQDYSLKIYGSKDYIRIAIANTGGEPLKRKTTKGYTIDKTAMMIATRAGMRNETKSIYWTKK